MFATLREGAGELQLFVNKAELGDDAFARFVAEIERGDWVGVEGAVMKTKKGELSVNVKSFALLAKSLRPLPEKWHGLSDTDTRFRQRYVDLIANDEARRVFAIRFAAVAAMRAVPRRARVHRGRDAGAAPDPRRRDRAPVRRRTTTRSTPTSTCASRPSCTSSG